MLIEVLGVTMSKAQGKGNLPAYDVADVNYKRDGKTEKKTLRGFGPNKGVVAFFNELNEFPSVVEVTSEKNDRGYWDWTKAEVADGAVPTPAPSGNGSKRNVFEERDERIVRQSSLERAVTIACHNNPKGAINVAEVLEIANTLVDWVLKKNVEDIDSDIPF